MRAAHLLIGTVLCTLLSAALASAQYPQPPSAPDMCGPGFYAPNHCGHIYGPGYCVKPCYPPFQGMVPGPKNPCPGSYAQAHPPAAPAGPQALGSPTFATHPYTRSPRDFFMIYEQWEPIVPTIYGSPTSFFSTPAVPYATPATPPAIPPAVPPVPNIPPVPGTPPVQPPLR